MRRLCLVAGAASERLNMCRGLQLIFIGMRIDKSAGAGLADLHRLFRPFPMESEFRADYSLNVSNCNISPQDLIACRCVLETMLGLLSALSQRGKKQKGIAERIADSSECCQQRPRNDYPVKGLGLANRPMQIYKYKKLFIVLSPARF